MRQRVRTLTLVIFLLPALASAQENLSDIAKDLQGRAERTVQAIDTYFGKPLPAGATIDAEELRQFRRFAGELKAAMIDLRQATAPLAGSADTFQRRFDEPLSVGDLVDLASRANFQRFIPLVDGRPACCDSLDKAVAPNEHALVSSLETIWAKLPPALLQQSIDKVEASYRRFEKKLLKGFPAMPWEYVFNFHGDRDGPSPHQLIFAHPSLGFEWDDEAVAGASQMRPVLAMQFGYNHYFFNRLNYVGAAFIATVNATQARDRWRTGGTVHFGNVLSIGATRGDERWMVFIASDRLGDKLVGALVKLR